MANTCPVCGGKLGLLNREKSADGLICAGCSSFFFSKLGFRAAKQPTAALADYWATLEQRRKVFKVKQLVGFVNGHKERVTIIDGISFFEHLPTLF